MKKYEFVTEDTVTVNDTNLTRIRALVDIPLYQVRAGDIGGYLEKESNLSHEGNCWVGGNAWVLGKAKVLDNSTVFGDAWVYGDAQVFGDAWVYGNATVHGDAWVGDNAKVYGNAVVSGDAWVYGEHRVYGDAPLRVDAEVSGSAVIPLNKGNDTEMKPLSLAIGTRVRFKSEPTRPTDVVTEIMLLDNSVEYAVGGSAWHARDTLVFVAEADSESLNEVFALREGDEDEDEE